MLRSALDALKTVNCMTYQLDENHQLYKNGYLRIWVDGLKAMLGWSEERTLVWAKKWEKSLDEESQIFYHQSPEGWMARVLIPEALLASLLSGPRGGLDVKHLVCRLANAIQADRPLMNIDENYTDEEWANAKARVQNILKEFGEPLPESRS